MNSAPLDEEVSKWDIALESLAAEEYRKCQRGLRLEDFQRLAGDYAIRLDDIMITMFELAIHGKWMYQDSAGNDQAIERSSLDELYVNGRLHLADLKAFDGNWRPV